MKKQSEIFWNLDCHACGVVVLTPAKIREGAWSHLDLS